MGNRNEADPRGRRQRLARVAALAAALACARPPDGEPEAAREAGGRSAWAAAGRRAQMERRSAAQWRRGRGSW